MDHDGFVWCFTCQERKHWKEMHAGHFFSRRNRSTRWDIDNARPQCPGCNRFGKIHGPGEPIIFERELIKEGVDVDALERRARAVRQWSEDELEELLHEYQSYLSDLERNDG